MHESNLYSNYVCFVFISAPAQDDKAHPPAAPAKMTDHVTPPTVCSGYGTISLGDVKLSPSKILKNHEEVITKYVKELDHASLVENVRVARRHSMFAEYISKYPGREWGRGKLAESDIIEFDMWLKKKEIAERLLNAPIPKQSPADPPAPGAATAKAPAIPKPATPAPTTAANTAPAPAKAAAAKLEPQAPKAPAVMPRPDVSPVSPTAPPAKAPKPTSPKADEACEILELSPSEKAAYKNYWSKFHSTGSPTPSTGVPSTSPSPDSSSGITPDVKKKLQLDGVTEGQLLARVLDATV